MHVANPLLLVIPLGVLALVAVFGFIGCTKDYDALGAGDGDQDGGGQDGGRPGGHGGPVFYSEVVDQSGPIAWWSLGDDVGPLVADKVGTHPGTYTGSAGSVTPGVDPDLDDSSSGF